MATFLQRIDAAPVIGTNFTVFFTQWLAVLVDTLNEIITTTQNSINETVAPSYTTAQITTLALTASNGTFWYDTDTNEIKALVNGVVVVIA
jgi:hypothetical protein